MDEKIIKIVANKLRKFGKVPINVDKLKEIRDEVYRATKTNKFASFANVRKWVKAARAHIKSSEKKAGGQEESKAAVKKAAAAEKREEPTPSVPKGVEESVNFIKDEAPVAPPSQEVVLPKPTIVFDKVYLQSIKFEIAGIRQTMERVSRQLDKLEKELTSRQEE